MYPTSAILSTDLNLLPEDTVWRNGANAIYVRTPTAPNFFWGNYMIVLQSSSKRTAAQLLEDFQQNFDCEHIAIAWDGEAKPARATIDSFVQSGFEIEHCCGMSYAQASLPEITTDTTIVRSIDSDKDWQRVVSLQQLMLGEDASTADRQLTVQRFRRFRKLVSQGNGFWLGVFCDEELIADLGLFAFNGVARFQQIETHPEFRRRGHCTSLVVSALHKARQDFGPIDFALEAEANSAAMVLYQKLGFETKETLVSAFKAPNRSI